MTKENVPDIRVLGSRVLIKEQQQDDKTKSGIILTQATQEPKCQGIVLNVGKGAYLESGERTEIDVEVGDTVIYAAFAGSPIETEEGTFIIINERDILAVIGSKR